MNLVSRIWKSSYSYCCSSYWALEFQHKVFMKLDRLFFFLLLIYIIWLPQSSKRTDCSSSFPQKTLSLCSTISFSATSPYPTPMWTVSQNAQRQNRLYLDGQEGEESSLDSTEQDAGHLNVDWLPRSQQYVCLFHTGRECSVGAV